MVVPGMIMVRTIKENSSFLPRNLNAQIYAMADETSAANRTVAPDGDGVEKIM